MCSHFTNFQKPRAGSTTYAETGVTTNPLGFMSQTGNKMSEPGWV